MLCVHVENGYSESDVTGKGKGMYGWMGRVGKWVLGDACGVD